MLDWAVVVVVEEVEVDTDELVEEVLTDVELVLVLEVEVDVLDVEVLLLVELVDRLVELVDVELVEVEEVELEVEEVEVDEVEVDVVTLSKGNNSPTATLYTRPLIPAEALAKLDWLIARI